jgi:hypothetical protein
MSLFDGFSTRKPMQIVTENIWGSTRQVLSVRQNATGYDVRFARTGNAIPPDYDPLSRPEKLVLQKRYVVDEEDISLPGLLTTSPYVAFDGVNFYARIIYRRLIGGRDDFGQPASGCTCVPTHVP